MWKTLQAVISLLQSLVLGAVQGITEFLPISSSAHLILVPKLFGWPDQGLVFDVAANSGTLLAVLWFFRTDLARLGRSAAARAGMGGERDPVGERLLGWLLLATVPVAVGGFFLRPFIEGDGRQPVLVAAASIGFGLVLAVADRLAARSAATERQGGVERLGWLDAIAIGLAQTLALFPGTSRSGVTISAGLFRGLDRETAARASLLLAIPVGVLVAISDLLTLFRAPLADTQWLHLLAVVVVSAVTGYLVIRGLLAWLRRRSLMVFVVYRLGFGGLLLWLAAR